MIATAKTPSLKASTREDSRDSDVFGTVDIIHRGGRAFRATFWTTGFSRHRAFRATSSCHDDIQRVRRKDKLYASADFLDLDPADCVAVRIQNLGTVEAWVADDYG